MNANLDASWSGDGLRERKITQQEQPQEHEEHEEQGNDAESEDSSREEELRMKKKTIGKTPDGCGE